MLFLNPNKILHDKIKFEYNTEKIGASVKKKLSLLASSLLLGSSLLAFDVDMSVGVHDFVVSDIVNDTPKDDISSGTSHTLGLNIGVIAKHKTPSDINILAKAEAFWDNDKDHLDPDHIPVWFALLFDIDGDLYKINDNHLFRWYEIFDTKQNTVSCIERQVREHIGVGYEYSKDKLKFDLNAYLGFYYIEFDDDTPIARGYTRQDTDDGESSNVFEIKLAYNFTKNFSLSGYAKHYSANTGMENLETDYELLAVYKNAPFLAENSRLNLEIKHAKYDIDRFFRNPPGIPIVPFDNDTLIQASVTIPLNY